MGYKLKPNKSAAKRFKVTKTGKLKRHHSFTSHLMSARPANKRRKLRKPAITSESLAKNMRKIMGISGLKPGKIAHERALRAKAQEVGATTETSTTATTKSTTATKAKK